MNDNVRSRFQRAPSVADLCHLWDSDFVREAYLAILGREADEEGERHFTAQLRAGAAKIRILSDLAFSEEGRAKSLYVPGLQRKLLLFRIFSRLPITGLSMSWQGDYLNSQRARASRRLENDVARLRRDSELTWAHTAKIAEKLDRLIERCNASEHTREDNGGKRQSALRIEQVLDLSE